VKTSWAIAYTVVILTGVDFSKALHWLTCVRCVPSDFEGLVRRIFLRKGLGIASGMGFGIGKREDGR
jgi:hypothetical protein